MTSVLLIQSLRRKAVTACLVLRDDPSQFRRLLASNAGPLGRLVAKGLLVAAPDRSRIASCENGYRDRLVALLAQDAAAMRRPQRLCR